MALFKFMPQLSSIATFSAFRMEPNNPDGLNLHSFHSNGFQRIRNLLRLLNNIHPS